MHPLRRLLRDLRPAARAAPREPLRDRTRYCLKASVDRLHVRLRLAPDVRGKEHRGNGDALVDLHSEAQLHGLIELVRQTTDAQPASDAPGESA